MDIVSSFTTSAGDEITSDEITSDEITSDEITSDDLKTARRMIAAAPELLKALEDMLWHMPDGEEKRTAPWVCNARAAIAKATL